MKLNRKTSRDTALFLKEHIDLHSYGVIVMVSRRARAASVGVILSFATIALGVPARAQSVDLVAAGSLNLALSQVAQAFNATTGVTVTQTYEPSGTLRQEIEAGLRPDVFASADTASPQALEQEGLTGRVVTFASNQIVAVFRSNFGQTVAPDNLLTVLLNPATKIGTSTPVADPLGDYTQEIFAKADAIQAGAAATLEAKRDELVANPSAPVVPTGVNSTVYFLDTTHTVDVFITYLTGAVQARAIDPTLQIVFLPKQLLVPAPFGLTVFDGASRDARKFAEYILSPPGQQILASYGFIPSCPLWARDQFRKSC